MKAKATVAHKRLAALERRIGQIEENTDRIELESLKSLRTLQQEFAEIYGDLVEITEDLIELFQLVKGEGQRETDPSTSHSEDLKRLLQKLTEDGQKLIDAENDALIDKNLQRIRKSAKRKQQKPGKRPPKPL